MATTESSKHDIQQIDLSKLGLQQLTQLKQQLDQELVVFQDSLHTLKMAQGKFQDSKESLEKITPQSKGKTIMVPLTSSMYVPGVLADAEKVIVDIGTGYYIQKDLEGAKDYFKRKVSFLTEQMEKIQAVGVEKTKARDVIVDIIEVKVHQQLAAQQVAAKT